MVNGLSFLASVGNTSLRLEQTGLVYTSKYLQILRYVYGSIFEKLAPTANLRLCLCQLCALSSTVGNLPVGGLIVLLEHELAICILRRQ